MATFRIMDEPDDAMNELYASNPEMCERIEDAFDALTADPTSRRFKTRYLSPPTPGRWVYIVYAPAGGEDWCFVWWLDPTTEVPEVIIDYVGPNVFE